METNKRKTKHRSREFFKYLGNRLKYFRILNKYSQEHIAQILGVTFQQIQKYESGANSIPLEKFILFAKILNLSLEELLGNLFYPEKTRFSNEILETLCFAKRIKDSKIYNRFMNL